MRASRRLEEPLPARLEGEETGKPGASTEGRKVDAGSGSCGFTVIERPGTKVSGLFVFSDHPHADVAYRGRGIREHL